MNHISLLGRLGDDPQGRHTPTNKSVTTFPLAVSEGAGEARQTMWVRCVAWDKTGELIAEHFRKGHRILVEGALVIRKYDRDGETKYATEVNVQRFHFIEKKPDVPRPLGDIIGEPLTNGEQS